MTVRIRRPHTGARFVHPMNPEPRTAVLASGFVESKLVRVFPHGWNEQTARFAPTSLAGPLEQLRRAARLGIELSHSVVAFTYAGDPGVSAEEREMLWDTLGVPVFEQYLAADNRLLAMECDAHCGLHVLADCGGLEVDHDPCACGNAAPRLTRGARIEELLTLLA